MGDDASQRSLDREISQLRAIVEELRAREDARQSRIAELLETSGDPRIPPPRARKPRRPNPHGLHIVRALAPVGACALAAARRPVVRRVAAGTLVAAVGTAGALSPDVIQHAPAAQLPGCCASAMVRHRHESVPVVLPLATLPRRKRRRAGTREATAQRPSQRPAPSPSPTGTAVPVPQPTPLPTIPLPTPVPSPLPTCVRLTGQHCHHGLAGALAGDAVSVPWALRGLTALS